MERSLKFWEETPKSAQMLRINENKRTEYTKKLIKGIPIRNVQRQGTNVTAWSEQWEKTGLGGIYNVEIRYQVSNMSEFVLWSMPPGDNMDVDKGYDDNDWLRQSSLSQHLM